VKAANLGLRFLLELCLLAALAYVGLQVSVVLAVVLPVAAAVIWGLFVSPKARFALPSSWWIAIQVVLFGGAVGGLIAVGSTVLGVVFGAVVATNLALVLFWHQRDTVA
jgi:Protein of unknown function (DUF2568)